MAGKALLHSLFMFLYVNVVHLQVRTALAAALFSRPDVLLLDEPTNHLSIDAVLWLSRELATGTTWKSRIVIVVSHDRFFIDDSCTDVIHISGVVRALIIHECITSLVEYLSNTHLLFEGEALDTE